MTPSTLSPADPITLDPAALSQKDVYKLMIGSIVPRPIAFVSTRSQTGVYNLAPYSFFNGVCSDPPTILFCPMQRGADGQKKDTLQNIEDTGEFVVNVVSEAIAEAMNLTAGEYPPEVDEFTVSQLTPVKSLKVTPPRVLESPVSMECKLNQVVYIGDGRIGSGSIVIGTIVQFHIHPEVYENGRIITEKLLPIGRLAGTSYCRTRDAFEIERPVVSRT